MSTRTWHRATIIAASVVLALVGARAAHAAPDVTIFETLDAGVVDSYLVQCGAGTTRLLHVQVCDYDDTDFMVQVIGRTPTGALGKVLLRDSPAGGCSAIGHFSRGATSGPMSAIVTVTERSNAGFAAYSLTLACEDKNNVPVGNITVTKKQDQ